MNNYTKLALAGLVTVALAFAAFPATNAQTGTAAFGTIVQANAADNTHVLAGAGLAPDFCYIDDNGSTSLNPTEPVFIDIDADGTVEINDIRVANPITGSKGGLVTGTSNDNGKACTSLGTAVGWFDADGDTFFGVTEVLYLDSDGSGTVTVSDIILSGAQAGTVVTGAAANNNPITGSGGAMDFHDSDNDGAFTAGDIMYWDDTTGSGATGFASVGDVRLSGSNFGKVVLAGDAENTHALFGGVAGFDFCYIDDNGSTSLNPTEPVFIDIDGDGTVEINDIRVANPITGSKGGLVTGTSNDNGKACTSLGTAVGWFDADGDTFYGIDEVLYLDSDGSGTVTVSDIILSGAQAGTVVTGAAANNNPITGSGGAMDFHDSDNDGAFTAGDIMYWDDTTGTAGASLGFASVGDVRLSGSNFGKVVMATDAENTYVLFGGVAGFDFCYIDDNGSTSLNPTEPVFIDIDGDGTVEINDIRVANPLAGSKGGLVTGTSNDNGKACTSLGTAVGWFDADGDTFYGIDEVLYLDSDGSGTVTVSDIILSGAQAGTVVTGAAANNNPITGSGGAMDFHDSDNDGAFTAGDIMYWDDTTGTAGASLGFASVGDVRLSGSVPSQTGTTTPPVTGTTTPVDGTTTPPVTGTTTPPVTGTTTPMTGTTTPGTTTTTTTPTPGLELVALVGALGAALILVRRKL